MTPTKIKKIIRVISMIFFDKAKTKLTTELSIFLKRKSCLKTFSCTKILLFQTFRSLVFVLSKIVIEITPIKFLF